jgi:hypothetical protein
MGEKALVETQITDAVELVRRLDKGGLSPTSAVWYYYSDTDEWRLLIAGSAFDGLLPRDEALAYQKIAEILGDPAQQALGSIGIADVKVVRTDDAIVRILRSLVKTSQNGLVRAHFTNTRINSVFVAEMFVLRAA